MIKDKNGKVLTHGKHLGYTFKARSKTLALGFTKLEDRLAQIQLAGLNTLMAADRKALLYDGVNEDQLPPPLPRHLEPDIADVSELYRAYRAQRAEIIENARVKRLAQAAKPPEHPPSGAPGSGGGVSAPVGGEPPK